MSVYGINSSLGSDILETQGPVVNPPLVHQNALASAEHVIMREIITAFQEGREKGPGF